MCRVHGTKLSYVPASAKWSLAVQTHGGWVLGSSPRMTILSVVHWDVVGPLHSALSFVILGLDPRIQPTRKTGINSTPPLNKIKHL